MCMREIAKLYSALSFFSLCKNIQPEIYEIVRIKFSEDKKIL